MLRASHLCRLRIALPLLALTACSDGPAPTACELPEPESWVEVTDVDSADLLFVVDDSASTAEEQSGLSTVLPVLMRMLTTGDLDDDGEHEPGEPRPLRSLNVGVITTDMGGYGLAPACTSFGTDGLLRTRGDTAAGAGCLSTYPAVLRYELGAPTTSDDFARDVACVTAVGTSGCGVEQPLEAMLKALTPTTAQPWTASSFIPIASPMAPPALAQPFFRDTDPHGDGANEGFSRASSLLAIVTLTDEDDCSAADRSLFDRSSPTYSGTSLGLLCHTHPEALHSIERYVEGLAQLRADPRLVIFAPLVGIPEDLATAPHEEPDWDRLRCEGDERLCERIDPSTPTRLLSSCAGPRRGAAYPPTRLLATGRGLSERGARVTVQSVCDASYRDAMVAIASAMLGPGFAADCVARELPLRDDGSVACEVRIRMPLGASCDDDALSPRLDARGMPIVDERGRSECIVRQLVPASRAPGAPAPSGAGWYYDDFREESACGEGPRIAYSDFSAPFGSSLALTCEPVSCER